MSKYLKILSYFPNNNIAFAFGYGSAVKPQKHVNNLTKKNKEMIDLIFAVEDSEKFHNNNIKLNSNHYSSLKFLGSNFIAKYQEKFAATLYYNTLINLETDLLIKYGVISINDLITDLLDWSHLYIAGRLHKPVEIIRPSTNIKLRNAMNINLISAAHAALLILPEIFSEHEFYRTVCSLSYDGDFRMIFGENSNKIENILKYQIHEFRNMYQPILTNLKDYVDFELSCEQVKKFDLDLKKNQNLSQENSELDFAEYCLRNCNFIQNKNVSTNFYHLSQLPLWPQRSLIQRWCRKTRQQDTEDCLVGLANHPDCAEIVKLCINEIVWRSSWKQSFKGIFTAGFLKSLHYSLRKISKMKRNYQ